MRSIIFCLLAILLISECACSEVTLLGRVCIPGTATDLSHLSDKLEEDTPHNRFGGFGSAIDYTGKDNIYVLLPDRGPADGATRYKTRIHTADIRITTNGSKWKVDMIPVSTVMLVDENGNNIIGSASNIHSRLRFDPEGIRITKTGSYLISDEYGPYIIEFSSNGKLIRRIPIPDRFLILHPNTNAIAENKDNLLGRQANRGMEGLALTPDAKHLYGIMQSPLIQDGGLNSDYKRSGINIRILKIDIENGTSAEYVYPLTDPSYGVNEILFVYDCTFLVIERDGKPGAKSAFKRIYKADLSHASDVSKIDSLPAQGLPDGIIPIQKSLLIDMLDPKYGLVGDNFPEKIEGLTFGPNLPDGRKLLLIATDNDFIADKPSYIYMFALDKSDL